MLIQSGHQGAQTAQKILLLRDVESPARGVERLRHRGTQIQPFASKSDAGGNWKPCRRR